MLLGNRYGFQQFPVNIDASMFETFLTIGCEMNLENLDLLKEWFKKDENAVPPHYVLQVGHRVRVLTVYFSLN